MSFDYTVHLKSIADSLQKIAINTQSIDETVKEIHITQQKILENPLTSVAKSQEELVQINDEILTRIKTKNLGIYMRQVEDSSSALTRAITVNALKQSNQIDDVASEVVRPTPIP